jgi:hypothetical protein
MWNNGNVIDNSWTNAELLIEIVVRSSCSTLHWDLRSWPSFPVTTRQGKVTLGLCCCFDCTWGACCRINSIDGRRVPGKRSLFSLRCSVGKDFVQLIAVHFIIIWLCSYLVTLCFCTRIIVEVTGANLVSESEQFAAGRDQLQRGSIRLQLVAGATLPSACIQGSAACIGGWWTCVWKWTQSWRPLRNMESEISSTLTGMGSSLLSNGAPTEPTKPSTAIDHRQFQFWSVLHPCKL